MTLKKIDYKVFEKKFDVDNGLKFGMGNIFGDNMIFHSMCQDNPRSAELFINKCKEVLGEN